jgi:serine/threonine protein kinase
MTQVAAGLAAVHEQNLVHRDIKPSNIMVRLKDDGVITAKIIDLGLAKAVNEPSGQTAISTPGAFAGTPEFASPEQFAGVPVDIRSDLSTPRSAAFHSSSPAPQRIWGDPEGIDDKHAVIDHQVLVRAIEPQLLAQWINRPGIQRPCLVCLSPVCSCLPGTGTTEDLWSRVRRLLCECASLAASSESIEREAQKGPISSDVQHSRFSCVDRPKFPSIICGRAERFAD